MRPLHLSIAIAASAVLFVACAEGGRTGSPRSQARETALAHDLELAGDSSLAGEGSGLDTAAVTDSPGMLGSFSAAESAGTDALLHTSNATNVSSGALPSAEGYVGPSCASPALDDQQRCLMGYLAKSDALLDRYYEALILRLKAEAGTRSSASEPPSVQRLRSAQRGWLIYRDDECRKKTRDREGPLWAPVRAQCLAEYAALRAEELHDALEKRRALAPRDPPKKAKRSHVHKSTHHARSRRR